MNPKHNLRQSWVHTAIGARLLVLLTMFSLMSQMPMTGQSGVTATSRSHEQTAAAQAHAKLDSLPLAFEPNRGQMGEAVQFASKGSRYSLLLTSSQAVFVLPEHLEVPGSLKDITARTAARRTAGPSTWTSITMRMIGSSSMEFLATSQLPGEKNYYIGRDKTKWMTGIPLYSVVRATNIYPGIDLAFHTIDRELEFDFAVQAGANPKRIKLEFAGAHGMNIDAAGDLVLSSSAGDLYIHRPVAYQETPDGNRSPVDVHFATRRNGQVQLALGAYDHKRQLIIDPSVTYATYLGGVGQDEGLGITVDSSGNTYVTGATASPNFPNTGGGFSYTGGLDVFVTGFNSSGQLTFSTLVGGSENDVGTSIALSPVGLFVTGYTNSNDFPVSTNFCGSSCFPSSLGALCGTQNAFVIMLLTSGAYEFLSSAYLGGSEVDAGLGIAVDSAYGGGYGYIYVAGQTTSPDFASCFPLDNESQINMGHGTGPSDGFVSKIAPSVGQFWFSTFLGGSDADFASSIALDNPTSSQTNIYITGGTVSPDFYTTPGVLQPTCGTDGNCNNGNDDAFITKLCTFEESPCNAQGLTPNYVYSTFLGGSGKDDAYSIAADMNGNAYLTGQTTSTDFKVQNPYQAGLRGQQNAFVSKVNPAGTALVFSTYLGGSQMDAGLGITIDPNDNVYVTGRTSSFDFPLAFPTQGALGGGFDAFVSAFDPAGVALTFSTFLGGSGNEDVVGGAIAVDSEQNVYVTGDTNSTDFPVQNPFQGSIGSTQDCTINGVQGLCPDAFVAKLNVEPPNYATLMVSINGGSNGAEGSVTSDPAGIEQCNNIPTDPPGICTANFALGTMVTLTATPFESQFAGWSGDVPANCGTNLTCQIQITGNASVTANFMPVAMGQLYTLLVQGAGVNGEIGTGLITSMPLGIDCGNGMQICMFDFASGTQVTLTATPDSGSFFDGWSQNPACSGTGQCTIVMNSNQTVEYTFLPNNAPPPLPDFTITISPQSLGTVPVGGQGVAGIAIAPLNGFTDTVNVSCSVLPALTSSPSCAISPSSLSIPVNGAGSATLTVNTTGLVAATRKPATTMLAFSIPFLGMLGTGVRARNGGPRNRWLRLLFGGLLLAAICFDLACGTSGGGGGAGGQAQPGTYTVVVSAQGSSTLITHTAQVTMTVQ